MHWVKLTGINTLATFSDTDAENYGLKRNQDAIGKDAVGLNWNKLKRQNLQMHLGHWP